MVGRRGAGTMGCLFSMLVVVALGYFGMQFGEAFLRAYRFESRMKAELKRSAVKSNAEIRETLRAVADSLPIPEEGHDVGVARSGRHIAIWADYREPIETPFHVQWIPFHPHAEGTIPADTASSR